MMIRSAQRPDAPRTRPRLPAAAAEVLDLARTLAVALLGAGLVHTVLIQPFTIPSSSMEPGLVTGDYILVSKFAYGWSWASPPLPLPPLGGRLLGRGPARGDVVVFRRPHDPSEVWIKRVVGVPGDTVQIRAGVVILNGRPLPQTRLGSGRDHDDPDRPVEILRERGTDGRTRLLYAGRAGGPADDTGVWRVPAGRYFMMGDNRDNSLDSRFPPKIGAGLVPAGAILGRAELVLASWEPGAGLLRPWTWLRLQTDRFLRPIA